MKSRILLIRFQTIRDQGQAEDFHGRIEFRNLTFAYDKKAKCA